MRSTCSTRTPARASVGRPRTCSTAPPRPRRAGRRRALARRRSNDSGQDRSVRSAVGAGAAQRGRSPRGSTAPRPTRSATRPARPSARPRSGRRSRRRAGTVRCPRTPRRPAAVGRPPRDRRGWSFRGRRDRRRRARPACASRSARTRLVTCATGRRAAVPAERAPGRSRDPGRPASRNDQAMGAERDGRTNQRTEIAWVGHAVDRDEKGRRRSLVRDGQHVGKIDVAERRHLRRKALVRQAAQSCGPAQPG